MLARIKADLKKHWLLWILLSVVVGLFIYAIKVGNINLTKEHIITLILVMIGSGLLFTGFNYLLKGHKEDTKYRQRTEEEIRDIYNNNPTITITLPTIKLPKFRGRDK